MSIRFTIQIVAWNNGSQLVECLRSVLASCYSSFEVLVLDNASPQDELSYVSRHIGDDARMRCWRSSENLFFAGGHNHISTLANGEFLILLNPDTVVALDWLEKIDELDALRPVQIGQLELRKFDAIDEPQTHGVFLDRAGFVRQVMQIKPVRERKSILGANGAALILRRSLWMSLGGFDENFGMYFEETDLCWRAARQGFVPEFLPGSVVRHVEGGSHGRSKKGFARSQYLFCRNRMWSLLKNLDRSELFWLFPLHVFLSLPVACRFLATDGWGKAWAVIAGLLASLPGWNRAVKMRVSPRWDNARLAEEGLIRREVLGIRLPGARHR